MKLTTISATLDAALHHPLVKSAPTWAVDSAKESKERVATMMAEARAVDKGNGATEFSFTLEQVKEATEKAQGHATSLQTMCDIRARMK